MGQRRRPLHQLNFTTRIAGSLSRYKIQVPGSRVKSLPFEPHADGPYCAFRGQRIPVAAHPIPSPSGESEDTLEHSCDAMLSDS